MKRSPLLVIFLTVFIDLLGFGIVLPLLPRYADAFDASDLTIGLLMSSFSAMQFVFAPAWGRLSDRIGRRPVLILGLAGSALFYGLFSYATWLGSLAWIFVARIGAGIAGATIPTAQAFIADSTTEQDRGKGMALIGAAFGIGFTFGPLLGSLWVPTDASAPPSPAPGVAAAVLSFVACVLAATILPESWRPGAAPAPRRWLAVQSLSTALRVPTVGLLLATFFVATFAFANFEGTLPRLTKDAFGFGDRYNFYLFAYVGVLLTLAQGVLVRRLMPVLGEVTMTVAGTVLMGLGLAGVGGAAVWMNWIVAAAALPVAVLGFASLTPSLQALISRRTAAHIQGEVLGVAQSASALARILGPLAGNVLYGQVGGHAAPYVFGACVMALAFVLSLGIGRGASQGP
jgi:MFS family permease